MEFSSGQGFVSDEGNSYLPIESYDEHSFMDDDLSTSIDLCLDDDASKYEGQLNGDLLHPEENAVEPQIGMEFDSRENSREFYITYGRRTGFTVRIHHNRRSRINNMIIGQDFVCSKEGFREKKYVHRKDRVLPPPPVTREGCPAMLRVALRDGSKWVITKFVKDHNHSLMSPSKVPWRGSGKSFTSQDEKDQRIRELTLELYNEKQRCRRRCVAYKEQLEVVLKYIEEHTDHLSRSVQDVVQRIKELEEEELDDTS